MQPRTTTRSTKVTADIAKQAENNLAKLGLTTSEYLRMSLAKAATGNVEFINYYDTPEFKHILKNAIDGNITYMGHNKKRIRKMV